MCSHPSSGSTTETRPRSSEGRPERIPARAAFLFGARCNLPSGRPAWYGTGWYHGRGRTRVRTRAARRPRGSAPPLARRPRGCGVRVPPLSSAWRLAETKRACTAVCTRAVTVWRGHAARDDGTGPRVAWGRRSRRAPAGGGLPPHLFSWRGARPCAGRRGAFAWVRGIIA
jgi:hypothetical protein